MSLDIFRGIFAGLLFIIGLTLWNDWQAAHPQTDHAQSTSISNTLNANNAAAPSAISAASSSQTESNILQINANTRNKNLISVHTDVLDLKIDPIGGALVHAALLHYPNSLQDSSPFVLFNKKSSEFYTAQSGLISPQGPDYQESAVYQSHSTDYNLDPKSDQLIVPLTWQHNGLTVNKTFVFTRGSYLIHVLFKINNQSQQVWQGQLYAQLKHTSQVNHTNNGFLQMNPFTGAVLSSPEKRYTKFSYPDLSKTPINQTIMNGWMAIEQHYFISAWIPNPNENFQYSSQLFDNNNLYAINLLGSNLNVLPGQEKNIELKLYVGPSIAKKLEQIAPGLNLTVDYGFLWPIGTVLFWLLDHIYDFVGNWGWSIVLLTLLIKLCFFQLTASSFKSMAAMRELQPQLQQIKERYGDDKQKVGQMTMELYKKEKINPMGGCLPFLIQIPVFLALYWVLFESVELRQAPFILWIHDLSLPDPFFVLPILMGLTMFIQQKISPASMDPTQAKIMLMMPLVMTFFFLNFPAGLVLYWVVSNTISILQQWIVSKTYHAKSKKV